MEQPERFATWLSECVDEDEAIAREGGTWPSRSARLLREVVAKRKIIAEHHATDWTAYSHHMCARCIFDDQEERDDSDHHWVYFPCPTLRAVAEVYSDQPGYQEAISG